MAALGYLRTQVVRGTIRFFNGQSGVGNRHGLHRPVMEVTINGQPETIDGEISVADLLMRRRLEPVRVAVEINEEIVPRNTFAQTRIRGGDRIEIVTFVGGGS